MVPAPEGDGHGRGRGRVRGRGLRLQPDSGGIDDSSNVKILKDKRSTNVPQTLHKRSTNVRHLTGMKSKCLSFHS